jgi:hypothetical protein
MSATIRYRFCTGPGAAEVLSVPNWIEAPDPAAVHGTIRKPLSNVKSASSRQPRLP